MTVRCEIKGQGKKKPDIVVEWDWNEKANGDIVIIATNTSGLSKAVLRLCSKNGKVIRIGSAELEGIATNIDGRILVVDS